MSDEDANRESHPVPQVSDRVVLFVVTSFAAAFVIFGFLVDSPTYVAFHALRYGGLDYPDGAMFTLRSLDGEPLARSRAVRIYHAFGPARVRLAGSEHEVAREAVVEPR